MVIKIISNLQHAYFWNILFNSCRPVDSVKWSIEKQRFRPEGDVQMVSPCSGIKATYQ